MGTKESASYLTRVCCFQEEFLKKHHRWRGGGGGETDTGRVVEWAGMGAVFVGVKLPLPIILYLYNISMHQLTIQNIYRRESIVVVTTNMLFMIKTN